MGYEDAPATQMIAEHCVFCGRPLVDAASVQRGYGPECANKTVMWLGSMPGDVRSKANKIIYDAAVLAQSGDVSGVLQKAKELEELGVPQLGNLVAQRFVNAAKNAKIVIIEKGNSIIVQTPYRHGDATAFIEAWRRIPGRRFDRGSLANIIPNTPESKAALWQLLCQFYPGAYGTTPQGIFRVPATAGVEEVHAAANPTQ